MSKIETTKTELVKKGSVREFRNSPSREIGGRGAYGRSTFLWDDQGKGDREGGADTTV
jgi:hypothetical protein